MKYEHKVALTFVLIVVALIGLAIYGYTIGAWDATN
jgi:hypothetical protein